MRRPLFWLSLCLILFSFWAVSMGWGGNLLPLRPAPEGPKENLRKQGDEYFTKKWYHKAFEAYRQYLQQNPQDSRIQYRALLCLIQLKRYTDASNFAKKILSTSQIQPLWKARIYLAMGKMYRQKPNWGYQKGGKIYWGRHVPGGRYIDTRAADIRATISYLEKARALYFVLAEKNPQNTQILKEWLETDLYLNQAVYQIIRYPWLFRRISRFRGKERFVRPSFAAKLPEEYSPNFFPVEKMIYLFHEMYRLSKKVTVEVEGHKLSGPNILYLLGMSLFNLPYPHKGPIEQRPPVVNPYVVWQKLWREFPGHERGAEVLILLGSLAERDRKYKKAETYYERVLKEFPKTKWVKDAKCYLGEMRKTRISIHPSGILLPGQTPTLKLSLRNVKKLQIQVSPFRLADFWQNSKVQALSKGGFTLRHYPPALLLEYAEKPLHSFQMDTSDPGDYRFFHTNLKLPITQKGAYLVEVRNHKVTAYQLIVVTSWYVVQKMAQNRVVAFVVDGESGTPIADANVLFYLRTQQSGKPQTKVVQAKTNQQGVAEVTHPEELPFYLGQVFVWKGKEYSLTGSKQIYPYYYWGRRHARRRGIAYVVTDRPLYRPGHKVNFKIYLRSRKKNGYQSLASVPVQVTVRDPRGTKVYQTEGQTNANGALWGSFTLSRKATLGTYRIDVFVRRRPFVSYGNLFRVEEYKKPEFLVSVKLPQGTVKVGQKVPIQISGKYYFGAPVQGATVHYQVFRSLADPVFYPSDDWDWLYGQGYAYKGLQRRSSYPYWRYQRSLVLRGTGTTDAQGRLSLSLDTSRWEKFPYHIEVQVTMQDISRRTVKGSGHGLVSPQAFYAYIFSERGYYQVGDKATFQLYTLTPDRTPVSVKGKIQLLRILPQSRRKPQTQLIEERPLQTDANGRAEVSFQVERSGMYRVLFSAKDRWGSTVQSHYDIWFASQDFTGYQFHFGSLTVVTNKKNYRVGEKVHLLVQSPQPNISVLITEEIERNIYRHHVLSLKGKTGVYSIPVEKSHIPNFRLSLTSVFQRSVHVKNLEVFVPPRDKILEIQIQPSQKEYRPGDKVKLKVVVRDSSGKPVSTPLCLSVYDASLSYIQSSLTPNIRRIFYGQLRRNGVPLVTTSAYRSTSLLVDEQPNYYKKYPPHRLHGFHRSAVRSIEMAEQRLAPAGAPRLLRKARADSDVDMAKGAPMRKRAKGSPATSGRGKKLVFPKMRRDFRDTAYWNPLVVTDSQGHGTVEFQLPDSLTTWHVQAHAMSPTTQVGSGHNAFLTRKGLMVRPQAPRFFVERDEVILSAVVHNQLQKDKEVTCRLELGPKGLVQITSPKEQVLTVKAKSSRRVDWKVKVLRSGQLKVRVYALTDEESDGAELTFPIYVHGFSKELTLSGVLRKSDKMAEVNVVVPKEIQPLATELEVILTPSLASAMLDALPYLSSYPYGCTEQTMSRFLPSVITSRVLRHMGISLELLAERQSSQRKYSPKKAVFSTKELARRVQKGLQRLYGFQHSDGGWGWWKGDQSNPYMSAYVVYGLYSAKKAGYPVRKDVLARGLRYLHTAAFRVSKLETQAYIAFTLAHCGQKPMRLLRKVYPRRDDLTLYGRALLALTYHKVGDAEKAKIVVGNILGYVQESEEEAFFPTSQKYWWYWYNNDIETNAWILRALVRTHPKHKVLPKLVKWLLKRRQGSRWSSTKTTAFVVFALADYLEVSGELRPEYTLTVYVDGKKLKEVTVTKKNALFFDNRLLLTGLAVPSGKRTIRIQKDGAGKLYYTVRLRYFSKEENLKGSGHGIQLVRRYYLLTPEKVTQTGRHGRTRHFLRYKRTLLQPGQFLTSGSLVEVEIQIKADESYEYVLVEDRKPAGLEPVELKSGYRYRDGLSFQMELRDEKVAFFLSWLSQGTHYLRYRLRAEVPGHFHALPTYAEAMYAPRVRAISDEGRIEIRDKK